MSNSDSDTNYDSPGEHSEVPEEENSDQEEVRPKKRSRPSHEKESDEPVASPRTEENLRIFAFSKIDEQAPVGKSEKKRFVCVFCKYKTAYYSNLYVHMRTHTAEKPYYCGACGHRASQGSTLKTHIKSRHGGNIDEFYNLDNYLRVKLKHVVEEETEIVIAPIINDEVIMTEAQLNSLRQGITDPEYPEPTTSTAQPEEPSQPSPQSGQSVPSSIPQNPNPYMYDPIMQYIFYQQQMLQFLQRIPFLPNFNQPMERSFMLRQPQPFHLRDMMASITGNSLLEGTPMQPEGQGTAQHSCVCSERLNSLRNFMRSVVTRLMSLSHDDPEYLNKLSEIIRDIMSQLQ